MEDQCLLGLDYMLSMGCELNFCSMTLKVRGKSVLVTAARHTRFGGEVRVLRTTVIPPRSELLLRCRASRSFDSNLGVVEPDVRSKANAGVMVGRTLVETSGSEVPDVVANISREPQKIKEGELVGLCQEVDHEWYQWKALSPLRELLVEFADNFSTSDLELECTDMVELSIDTGDHRPIKQPARRMAPAQRQEMEKVMENLRSQGVIEKSSSPWTSAVVLVRKKDGSVR
ncbi:hypothetical protein Pcinc_002635 [Petrolisthes cinctipes]|uniref:Uncharacterized protein n=1 Tax=Petrolisthes cinctipes TaxID=88211 RepID=A0AAE1GKI9_PETCI|nr:hypothetical protein Pcinc_002635 [Petrolisthes cinctipes]